MPRRDLTYGECINARNYYKLPVRGLNSTVARSTAAEVRQTLVDVDISSLSLHTLSDDVLLLRILYLSVPIDNTNIYLGENYPCSSRKLVFGGCKHAICQIHTFVTANFL